MRDLQTVPRPLMQNADPFTSTSDEKLEDAMAIVLNDQHINSVMTALGCTKLVPGN